MRLILSHLLAALVAFVGAALSFYIAILAEIAWHEKHRADPFGGAEWALINVYVIVVAFAVSYLLILWWRRVPPFRR